MVKAAASVSVKRFGEVTSKAPQGKERKKKDRTEKMLVADAAAYG